jgi:hypothetical protein
MTPARVKRHGEIGIIRAHHVGDDDRCRGEPVRVNREVIEPPVQARAEHLARALAHRGCAEQRKRRATVACAGGTGA